jgi:hypothetical protein
MKAPCSLRLNYALLLVVLAVLLMGCKIWQRKGKLVSKGVPVFGHTCPSAWLIID